MKFKLKSLLILSFLSCAALCFPLDSLNAQTTDTPTNQSDLTNLSDVNPIPEPKDIDSFDPTSNTDIQDLDEIVSSDFVDRLGPFYGTPASMSEIQSELAKLSAATKTNPALIYVIKSKKGLRLILVTSDQSSQSLADTSRDPNLFASRSLLSNSLASEEFSNDVIFKTVPEATSGKVNRFSKSFRRQVSDPSNLDSRQYLKPSQQLYDWIIRPLEADLQTKQVDTIIFVMSEGLRTIPVAALHDGERFLVEDYNLSLIPSFNLTDTRYESISGTQLLAMGITESVEGLSPLPSVGVEVPALASDIWQGQSHLNQGATLVKLKELTQQKQFDIIHLATHAEFNSGNLDQSFIQLWDQKINYSDLRQVADGAKWGENPTIELLVLSACTTALGNANAELGFTGLALQTGVKSVLGSLWYVSDEGTMALMGEFYEQLDSAPIKSAALREAQLALLNGDIVLEKNVMKFPNGLELSLPNDTGISRSTDYTHPYYWSSFTLVGNWN